MAVPTPEKTWEFSLDNFVDNTASFASNDEQSARYMSVALLNIITDKKKKAWGGTFTDQGGGTVRFTPTSVGGDPYGPANNELYDSSDVGLSIVFVGCNSAGNDGTFTVTAVDATAGAWVEFVNGGTPVFETDTGCSVHILRGNFTTPLTVKGTSGSGASRGAGMDGKDRWLVGTDINSNTSGNRDWFVVQNSTGCELLFWHDTFSSTYQWERAVIQFSCENGFTGGTETTAPTATDSTEVNDRSTYWGPYSDPNNKKVYWSVMMSTDGQHFRCWSVDENFVNAVFIGMEVAKDPLTAGALIPWNGNNNVGWWVANQGGNGMGHGSLRDSAAVKAVLDKDATAGGPYTPSCYLTSEMVASQAITEQISWEPNRLTNEVYFFPIGIFAQGATPKGRIGRLADIWFTHADESWVPTGSSFPANGAMNFMRVGDLILPWDGATPLKKRVV